MQRIKNSIYVLVMLLSFTSYAQSTAKEVLELYKDKLAKTIEYQVNLTYKIYKGHTQKEAHQITKGVFYKKNDKMYTKLGEAEMVNTPKTYLKINHIERAILVTDGVEKPNELNINLDDFFKYLKAEIVDQTDVFWTIELTPKGKITQLPFSKLIVEIHKKTYEMKRQLFFYHSQLNFSKDIKQNDIANVKLEVLYENYKRSRFNVPKNIFNLKQIFLKVKGKNYEGIGRLKGYEIINKKRLGLGL
jgi:hypothetical protein